METSEFEKRQLRKHFEEVRAQNTARVEGLIENYHGVRPLAEIWAAASRSEVFDGLSFDVRSVPGGSNDIVLGILSNMSFLCEMAERPWEDRIGHLCLHYQVPYEYDETDPDIAVKELIAAFKEFAKKAGRMFCNDETFNTTEGAIIVLLAVAMGAQGYSISRPTQPSGPEILADGSWLADFHFQAQLNDRVISVVLKYGSLLKGAHQAMSVVKGELKPIFPRAHPSANVDK